MKRKTTSKIVAAKSARSIKKSPKKVSAKSDKIEVPAKIKEMKKKYGKLKADEMILLLCPNANQEAVAGLVSGVGGKTKKRVPKWVKAASSKAFEAMGLGILKSMDKDFIKTMGLLTELGPQMPAEQLKKSKLPIEAIFEFIKLAATKSTPLEAKQFAEGRIEAAKVDAKASALQQRGKIYMLISVGWQQVSKLQSTTELLQWLLSFNDKDEIFIYVNPGSDYTREIRAICKSIGLKFNNPGGRPKKT